MPNFDTKKLTLAAKNTKLKADERNTISAAATQLKILQAENAKLKTSNSSETALRKNVVVKKIIDKEKKAFQTLQTREAAKTKQAITAKDLEISKLKQQVASLKKPPTLTSLKQNVNVKKIIDSEKDKFTKILVSKDAKITQMQNDLKAVATKPIGKAEFNKFISDSVLELQQSFNKSQQDQDSEIIIRDVEIEASVITEMQGNKPVHVVPSRKDMLELGSNNFQKLKYMLSVLPKE